jgi:hypothetical protein
LTPLQRAAADFPSRSAKIFYLRFLASCRRKAQLVLFKGRKKPHVYPQA